MRYVDLQGQNQKLKSQKSIQANAKRSRDGGFLFDDLFLLLKNFFRFLLRHWRVTGFFVFLFAVGLVAWYSYTLLSSLNVKAKDLVDVPQAAVHFVTNQDSHVANKDGRTNVLLLGIGGEGHEGPYLTDSIMVASIDIETSNVVLISLPRDIWVTSARAKINAVYAFAREQDVELGLPKVRSAVEEVLGIPVHYALRIDFNGFRRAIDLLGGVEVDVARAFVDSEYPIEGREKDMCGLVEVEEEIEITPTALPAPDENGDGIPDVEMPVPTPYKELQKRLKNAAGDDKTDSLNPFACRYETIRFDVGKRVMDGATALKFVRSRHGTNGEGSDFARADRQQRVIAAFKNQVLSAGTLLNPARVTSLIQEFGRSIDTDIKIGEYGEFIKIAKKLQDGQITTHTISAEGAEALLSVPPSRESYGGAYVLVPKGEGWGRVHSEVEKWLSRDVEVNASPESDQNFANSVE